MKQDASEALSTCNDHEAAVALAQMVAAHGWVGVTSDYVGMGTAGPNGYLVGQAEARNVLDATRAAHHLPGLALDYRTVVWGHSQGGHGAIWTGIVAPTYAPDVKILGVAAMALASDLVPLAQGDQGQHVREGGDRLHRGLVG